MFIYIGWQNVECEANVLVAGRCEGQVQGNRMWLLCTHCIDLLIYPILLRWKEVDLPEDGLWHPIQLLQTGNKNCEFFGQYKCCLKFSLRTANLKQVHPHSSSVYTQIKLFVHHNNTVTLKNKKFLNILHIFIIKLLFITFVTSKETLDFSISYRNL